MDPAQEPLAGGGLQRRPAAAAAARGRGVQEPRPRGQRAIHPDVDPPPRPWPGMQKLAIVAIVVLGCLQFLPATHFRDPSNPRGGWISVDDSRNSADSFGDTGSVDVFTWISCLDLHPLAVLTNSTLTSSSDPQNISFHFLIPEGGNGELPYYKLKVVLPDANIIVTSQKQIKDKLNVATPEGNLLWSFHMEVSPLLIGTTQFFKKRYVYTAADSIIKVLTTVDLVTDLFEKLVEKYHRNIFSPSVIVLAVLYKRLSLAVINIPVSTLLFLTQHHTYATYKILSQGKIEDLAHLDLGTYAIGAGED